MKGNAGGEPLDRRLEEEKSNGTYHLGKPLSITREFPTTSINDTRGSP